MKELFSPVLVPFFYAMLIVHPTNHLKGHNI